MVILCRTGSTGKKSIGSPLALTNKEQDPIDEIDEIVESLREENPAFRDGVENHYALMAPTDRMYLHSIVYILYMATHGSSSASWKNHYIDNVSIAMNGTTIS